MKDFFWTLFLSLIACVVLFYLGYLSATEDAINRAREFAVSEQTFVAEISDIIDAIQQDVKDSK